MRAGARLAAFGASLGVVFGAAALAGGALDPLRDADERHAHDDAAPAAHGAHAAGAPGPPAGLAVADGGLALEMERATLPRGREATLAFRVAGPDGETVRDFDVGHERRMHLIVVRRDLTGYRHLHPEADRTGRWTVRVRLPDAGAYRAFADFRHDGRPHTLAADVLVDGAFASRPLPSPRATQETDGYAATLSAAGAAAGGEADLAYDVARGGAPVADLEPYLGAEGHLVALREGDLAFLHAHPYDSAVVGRIDFRVAFPSAGRYRLFLQFRHEGVVRTVAHTVEVAR
jgi:hypothetical protein